MASIVKPSDQPAKPAAQFKPDVDRKALREEINQRYEHTLRRLGR